MPAQMGQFDFDERLCLVEFFDNGDHRKHQFEAASSGCAQKRAHLAAQQAWPVQTQPDRTPAQCGVFFFDIAHVRQHLVATDIEGAERHRFFSGSVEHGTIERKLLAGTRQRIRHHELQFGPEQADACGAGILDMGKVDGQAGIDHQRNFLAILGDARPLAQRAILRLPAGA
jgi:hypothetical protein